MVKCVLWGIVLGMGFGIHSASAEIASEWEPDYAEAVLAYNSRNFSRALEILNQLQKRAPGTVEILELKAITLKASEKPTEAAGVYRDLVQLKTKGGADKKEIAPYAFELGVLRFNEKRYQQSEQYLNYAIRSNFNPEVANFYIGLIGVQTKDWDKAEKHLLIAAEGKVDDIRPAAHLYLGQVYFQKGVTSNGFGELIEAKRAAQNYIDRQDVPAASKEMSEQVVKGVDTALAPFDKSQVFANFSAIAGYDSNVLLVPSESDAAASASEEATLKMTFSAGAGYATSPLNRYQLVPSIRMNANKNTNKDTTAGEFTDTVLSLFVTRDALAPFSYGLKLEGSVIFQNEYNSTTDSSKYRLYSSFVGLGPYFKKDLNTKWSLNGELTARLVSYNGDDEIEERLRRNGPAFLFRGGVQSKTAKKYWNPSAAIKLEYTDTQGQEFQSMAYGLLLSNTFRVKEIQLTQGLELTRTNYPDSANDRGDTLFGILVSAHRKIGPRWAVLASVDYTRNNSSEETAYSYNRYTINGGVSYAF